MSINTIQSIQRQINEIEDKIRREQGDVRELKKLLERLRMYEFEEDLRESDNRQLLKG